MLTVVGALGRRPVAAVAALSRVPPGWARAEVGNEADYRGITAQCS
jgi:hypothetical protein